MKTQTIYRITGNDKKAAQKAALTLQTQEMQGGKIVRLYREGEPEYLPEDADVIIILDVR